MAKRPSARLVIIDAESRTLLFRFAYKNQAFWATPGGGLEMGESFEQAAKRELFEETGLRLPIGPKVFDRNVQFSGPEGETIDAIERYFVVKTHTNDLDFSGWKADERENITETAWFTPDDILVLRDPVYPENIADLVRVSAGEE